MRPAGATEDAGLRATAMARLQGKRDVLVHIRVYLAVNTLLVAIWALSGAGFFWPIFPMLGWGIGVGAHAWDVFWRKPIGEEEIQLEVERLRSRS